MIPEQKAIELVEKFKIDNYDWIAQGSNVTAKKYALIAVDEIINNMPYGFYSGLRPAYNISDLEYWQQVKTEIEKL